MFAQSMVKSFVGSERTILSCLLNADPRPVRIAELIIEVYGYRDRSPIDANLVIRQVAHRLRRKLPAFGWTLSKDSRSSRGYRLLREV